MLGRLKPITVVLLFIVLSSFGISAQADDKPFYGFYPSELGPNFKRFEHNILGFSIDVPNDWTFGINGTGATTVAILYPEGLNTAVLTDSYKTIEIGFIPYTDISLSQAYEFVLLGLKEGHPNLEIEEAAHETKTEDSESLEFLYSWTSKNGSTIKEWINLIPYKNQIRSVTVRFGKDQSDQRPEFKKIVETYKAKDLKL